MLLAIDPGEDTGWGLFAIRESRFTFRKGVEQDYELIACGLGDPRDRDIVRASKLERVVIERPRINPHGKARPNDIITLALSAGEWAGVFRERCNEIVWFEPHQWKGAADKVQSAPRIWAKLSPVEQAIVHDTIKTSGKGGRALAQSKIHNVLDGIGLGLHAVGRGMR